MKPPEILNHLLKLYLVKVEIEEPSVQPMELEELQRLLYQADDTCLSFGGPGGEAHRYHRGLGLLGAILRRFFHHDVKLPLNLHHFDVNQVVQGPSHELTFFMESSD